MATGDKTEEAPRETSLAGALLSGFVATGAMTVTLVIIYFLSEVIGVALPAARIMTGLVLPVFAESGRVVPEDTLLAATAVHLAFGLIWAIVYVYLFRPFLPKSGPESGTLFGLVPWLLSILVFFPAVGAGLLGLGLGVGLIPAAVSFLVHLVYGATLGTVYAMGVDYWPEHYAGEGSEQDEREMALRTERGGAIGLIAGLLVGGAAGWALGLLLMQAGVPTPGSVVAPGWLAITGAVVGAAAGVVGGSILGIGERSARP